MQIVFFVALSMLSCAAGSKIVAPGDCCDVCVQFGPCQIAYHNQFFGRKCCKDCTHDEYVETDFGFELQPICDDTYCCTCQPEGGYTCETCTEALPLSGDDALKCKTVYDDPGCDKKLDIAFVMDCSLSISSDQFNTMRQFVREITIGLNIDSTNSHVGAVTFGGSAQFGFSLSDGATDADVENEVANIVNCRGGSTNIAAGIRMAREDIFCGNDGDRPDCPDIMVVISDGEANVETENTLDEAQEAKDKCIQIITVGIGNFINKDELDAISSMGMTFETDFDEIMEIVDQIVEKACELSEQECPP